eukprot:g31855.t1
MSRPHDTTLGDYFTCIPSSVLQEPKESGQVAGAPTFVWVKIKRTPATFSRNLSICGTLYEVRKLSRHVLKPLMVRQEGYDTVNVTDRHFPGDTPEQVNLYRAHSVDYQRLRDYVDRLMTDVGGQAAPGPAHAETEMAPLVGAEEGGRSEAIMPSSPRSPVLHQHENLEHAFLREFEAQAHKVESFYNQRVREVGDALFRLQDNTTTTLKKKDDTPLKKKDDLPLSKKDIRRDQAISPRREQETANPEAKAAYRQWYRELVFLQSYCRLNYAGLLRVLEEHDAESKFIKHCGEQQRRLQEMDFFNYAAVRKMLTTVEHDFASTFCDGSHKVALEYLLQQNSSEEVDFDLFSLGVHFGCICVLAIWVLWDCLMDFHLRPKEHFWTLNILPIYRGLGCLLLCCWCWTCNLWVWDRACINYTYLFELDAKATVSFRGMFRHSTKTSLVSLVNFLAYYKMKPYDKFLPFPVDVLPLLLLLYYFFCLAYLFRPSSIYCHALLRTLFAPFFKVKFLDAYVADVLTSLVKVIIDMAFAVCWVFSGDWLYREHNYRKSECATSHFFSAVMQPVLTALPLWFRLAQCLRQYRDTHNRWPFIGNAGKYAVAQTVVIWGAFHHNFTDTRFYFVFYIIFLLISSLYSYSWDVFMDWGLGLRSHGYLRSRLLMGNKNYYYAAMVLDLALRFTWSLTLIPVAVASPLSKKTMQILTPLLAMLEIMRRTFWSWFRLEHEHLSNTMGYRRIDLVPYPFFKAPPERLSQRRVLLEAFGLASVVLSMSFAAYLTGVH